MTMENPKQLSSWKDLTCMLSYFYLQINNEESHFNVVKPLNPVLSLKLSSSLSLLRLHIVES